MAWKYQSVLGIAAILLLTLLAFIPAFRAGYIWDDQAHVTENLTLRTAEGLERIWFEPQSLPQYYPLVHTTFWMEYHLWGLNPFGYHLVNVLLHAVSAILLWRLLKRLGVPGAFVAAAVFALHPVHVESVAWVTERKNVLSLFFYLTAALSYFSFALPPSSREGPRRLRRSGRSRQAYALSLVLFLCALLSKTVTCTLPAAILLVLWWKKESIRWRDVLLLLPLFAIGIILGLITVYLEKIHVGAVGEEWSLSFMERCLLAGRIPWFYAWKLLWPLNLMFIYPQWQIDTGAPWQYIFPLATVAVIIALFVMHRRTGKGPLVAVLFYLGSLAPALGFFNVYPMRYSYVADHFQYMASVGLIALATALGCHGLNRRSPWVRRSTVLLAALLLALLGTLTWNQCRIYKNGETLWLDTIKKNPDSWMAHNNLGLEYKSKGLWEKALQHFSAALAIKPDHARAHINLGAVLQAQQRPEEAIFHFRQALRINPDYAKAHNNLGAALLAQGEVEEAIHHYREAIRLDPSNLEAHYNLGLFLKDQNQHEEAAQHFREVLSLQPGFWLVYIDLGRLLQDQGKHADAINLYGQALRIKPGSLKARYYLGRALVQQGRHSHAVPHFKRALKGRPEWPEALDLLAIALAGKGKYAEAVDAAEKALNLAEARGMKALVEAIKERLALYREEKHYSGPLPEEARGGQ